MITIVSAFCSDETNHLFKPSASVVVDLGSLQQAICGANVSATRLAVDTDPYCPTCMTAVDEGILDWLRLDRGKPS